MPAGHGTTALVYARMLLAIMPYERTQYRVRLNP